MLSVEAKVRLLIARQMANVSAHVPASTGIDERAASYEPTTKLEDIGATSLDLYSLLTAIESEFELTVPDEAIARIKTVQDLISLASGSC
jgi:acyl carrier protein